MEFTLLGAALVAVLGVYGALWYEARRGNAAECTRDLWDIALTAMIVGLAVGRLAAMVGDGVNPLTNPQDIVIVRAGVATGPAAAGALAWVAWAGRGEVVAVMDGLAVAALTGLAGWHAACGIRETCLGTPSDLPWAIAQPGSSVTRHPVEVYAAVAYLIAAVALARVRPLPRGVAAGLGLALAGIVRLATEPYRPSLSGGPLLWYLAALVGGGAIGARALLQARSPRAPAD